MLTAIVLRSGKEDKRMREKCIESLGKLPVATIIADFDPTFSEFGVSTDYVLYIYDDERLTESLSDALPTFFYCDQFDYLSLYRRSSEGIDKCPRIFRNNVVLHDKRLYPVNIASYVGETVLNGWLEEIE